MAVTMHDFKGLRCPQPTLRLTTLSLRVAKGDVLEISADCTSFEKDIRDWCGRNKKTLLWIRDQGGSAKVCQIQF